MAEIAAIPAQPGWRVLHLGDDDEHKTYPIIGWTVGPDDAHPIVAHPRFGAIQARNLPGHSNQRVIPPHIDHFDHDGQTISVDGYDVYRA